MKQFATTALALSMLTPVFAAEPELQLYRAGTRAVTTAPAQNFTGSAQVEVLYAPAGLERASAGSVTFSPGARTAWLRARHGHPCGRMGRRGYSFLGRGHPLS